ncbi:MAG TPA: DUF2066 domain-containing protein [Hyphomicrobium sp.]
MQEKRRRILCASLAVAAALAAGAQALAVPNAARNDEVYTVGNYPVDAQAANAVAAKEKALADGQQSAFRSLLKRVVPVTDYDRLKRLSSLRSSNFFEGVSVRSERNSSTRYIASLDFSFRADSVRAVLQQEGIPFVEEQAREVIVVPAVRDIHGAVDTGAASRAWNGTWQSLDLEHTLTPVDLQRLKPEVHADTLKMLIEGRGGERILASEYGRPYVVVALAEPDTAQKRLNVTLVGIDAVGPLNLRRSYRVFDGDTGYTMELAAVVGQGVLEGRWKAFKTGTGAVPYGEVVAIEAEYGSLAEWSEMRRELLGLPGVNDLRIEAESAQGAGLKLRYPGGATALAAALRSRGLSLESGGDGWVLRSGY